MNLIKIKVNYEDRETLASMLDYAVAHTQWLKDIAYNKASEAYCEVQQEKFKELRQRVVYEELEE